jgi:hypothetical protein
MLGYHRVALLMFPKSSADELIFRVAGATYALSKMSASSLTCPNGRDTEIIQAIMKHLPREAAEDVAQYAISWNDLDLWKRAANQADY